MLRSSLARRIVFRLLTHDTPYVSPRNIAEFCVDCRQAAGGVSERRIPAQVTLAQLRCHHKYSA